MQWPTLKQRSFWIAVGQLVWKSAIAAGALVGTATSAPVVVKVLHGFGFLATWRKEVFDSAWNALAISEIVAFATTAFALCVLAFSAEEISKLRDTGRSARLLARKLFDTKLTTIQGKATMLSVAHVFSDHCITTTGVFTYSHVLRGIETDASSFNRELRGHERHATGELLNALVMHGCLRVHSSGDLWLITKTGRAVAAAIKELKPNMRTNEQGQHEWNRVVFECENVDDETAEHERPRNERPEEEPIDP
ncbi:MAG: hypothetical protein JNL28_13480 [Planctomycetes bacterium]|nr:hypothetical protein [Planctomycetota bacterium]